MQLTGHCSDRPPVTLGYQGFSWFRNLVVKYFTLSTELVFSLRLIPEAAVYNQVHLRGKRRAPFEFFKEHVHITLSPGLGSDFKG
jgi:hypothetical protein